MSELTLENWINLQEKLAAIGPSLNRIWEAYHAELDDRATAYDEHLMKQYEKWYDENFDEYPMLGYDFSVGYMEAFWEAGDKVLKYLEDHNWEVWMIADY